VETRLHSPFSACLAALLMLATATTGGWLVLCVGEDGHRAIEWPHPAGGCDAPPLGGETVAFGGLAPDGKGCLDLPAVGLGVLTSRSNIPTGTDASAATSPAGPESCGGDPKDAPPAACRGTDGTGAPAWTPRTRLRGVVLLT
jgi:hypothetical protein